MFGKATAFGPAFGLAPLRPDALGFDLLTSPTPSSSSSEGFSTYRDGECGAAFAVAQQPAYAPALPRFTAAVPLSHGCCTVADMHNLQLSAQLLLDPIRGPTRAQVSAPPARELLGLGDRFREHRIDVGMDAERFAPDSIAQATPKAASSTAPAPPCDAGAGGEFQASLSSAAPARAPEVNGWLSRHPILGSVLAPSGPQNLHLELPTGADASTQQSSPRTPRRPTLLGEEGDGDLPAAVAAETAELLVLVRQLVDDSKRRYEIEELAHRSTMIAAAEASKAAAVEAKAAAERCAAVVDREDARRAEAEMALASARKMDMDASAEASAELAKAAHMRRQADTARHRQVALASMSRWSVMEGSNLTNCCLQAWCAFVSESINDRNAAEAEARALHHPPNASAQTQTDESIAAEAVGTGMAARGATEAHADAPPAFTSAGAPPTLPGGVLRALRGEEVWMDMSSGAITGAALWLAQKPPEATRNFVRTFDICLPWAEARRPGESDASSATTLDPSFLAGGALPPGSFLRSEPLNLPASPYFSPPTSPAHSRHSGASSPARSRPQSPSMRSPAKSLVRSPAASRASLLVDEDDDRVTASQVLQRISGLMTEMTEMEASLGDLREELDATVDGDGSAAVAGSAAGLAAISPQVAALHTSTDGVGPLPKRAPPRLRHRLPLGLARPGASSSRSVGGSSRGTPAPVRRSSSAACASRMNALTRAATQRGRPPLQVASSKGRPQT